MFMFQGEYVFLKNSESKVVFDKLKVVFHFFAAMYNIVHIVEELLYCSVVLCFYKTAKSVKVTEKHMQILTAGSSSLFNSSPPMSQGCPSL